MRAVLSVYDKTGIVEFGKKLQGLGIELISTGGTFDALSKGGLPVKKVSDITQFPEMMDGRVKTLHPAIHGGLLALRDKPEHMAELNRHGITPIDMVVGNLYPFEATVSRPGIQLGEALENIDIGGPSMLRSASKNFPSVVVLVDPADYDWVVDRIKTGGPSLEERRKLAAKAFQHVAAYDTLISRWLRGMDVSFPNELSFGFRKLAEMRYGENPHQRGSVYAEIGVKGGIVAAQQLGGKEMSFNNYLDAEAAWKVAMDFPDPTAVVIKHTNPCGVASHGDLAEAYRRAFEGDSVSAYGGIVGFNRMVTGAAAEAMRRVFYEIVVAPGYTPEALEILQKKKDLRILAATLPTAIGNANIDLRRVSGGLLVQAPDEINEDASTWKVVTERKPTPQELADLAFAWKVAKHVKSNAIVLAKDKTLAGMGAGQPNRITSVHLALRIAGEKAKGCALASDAFFPFPDGLELGVQGGATSVAQPGGSIRDEEVIAAANKAGIAMVFTGTRHFKH
ncbi:MAG: bifunctional phosphoribosylaminoimidazolecarboxamide formyltransferase/IMP cyclohydrolase [Dehalococcoidia bacterium]|nr:bifunctional phosphoribosylaminoimidazolecarboxamide formyltransferase/IMP cyclohydrolase [Dehalococcoidia bacterium]